MAVIDQYLAEIVTLLKTQNAAELRFYFRVEPPLPDMFQKLSQELKTSWRDTDTLQQHIAKFLPIPKTEEGKAEVGNPWPGFVAFVKDFLVFWRDVNFADLPETHSQLGALVNSCITALSHVVHGLVILPTAIQLCSDWARLAIQLDKRPDLTRHLRKIASVDQSEGRKTLLQATAESIQRAVTICLIERSSNRDGIKDGKPEGKKIGIYSFANLVLKLFFQCRKPGAADQLFTNITQNSPQLSFYPASQRVTYLYYLGRFLFSNSHFYRAQLCLQAAYDQCHAQCINQRRLILIYLITSNMILGRFPGPSFMTQAEAAGILEKFAPVSRAIRRGNIIAFKRSLGPESGNEQWFFRKGILLPLLYRCEVLVWRSLARRVFLLTYQFPSDPNSRKAPTLDLMDLVAAAQYCQKVLEGWQKPVDSMAFMQSGRTHTNSMFMKAPDLVPPQNGSKKLGANQGTVFGNKMPDLLEVEAIVASLVQQGLLRGFISHNQGKFAILGAKQRGGALNAGFPVAWEVIKSRADREGRDSEVPGWVRGERKMRMGGVVNLSGIARPVGSGM